MNGTEFYNEMTQAVCGMSNDSLSTEIERVKQQINRRERTGQCDCSGGRCLNRAGHTAYDNLTLIALLKEQAAMSR